jgi:hypothetical protein
LSLPPPYAFLLPECLSYRALYCHFQRVLSLLPTCLPYLLHLSPPYTTCRPATLLSLEHVLSTPISPLYPMILLLNSAWCFSDWSRSVLFQLPERLSIRIRARGLSPRTYTLVDDGNLDSLVRPFPGMKTVPLARILSLTYSPPCHKF